MSIGSLWSSAVEAKNKVYGNGKLEKAYIISYKKSGSRYEVADKMAVQFNPSEYSIQRYLDVSEKKRLSKDSSSNDVQAVSSGRTTLSVSLYLQL
jgi:hypothetical protein